MKRWSMSVTSWVDGLLAQVENQEAIVSSAIERARQSMARARAQLKGVERDQQTLKDTLRREGWTCEGGHHASAKMGCS
jgi:hypothetical protein